VPHCHQCVPQFVRGQLCSNPLAERVRHEAGPANRPVSGLSTGEQLGAPVRGIRPILRQMVCNEKVGEALHTLPRHSHPAPDLGHGARLIHDAAQHLPHQAAVRPPLAATTWAASKSRALRRKVVRMTSVSRAPLPSEAATPASFHAAEHWCPLWATFMLRLGRP
jgi:hypothetical protein